VRAEGVSLWVDPLTGACYDHRKQFIQDRLESLAGVLAIDVMAYAIMSNHFHMVLRTRPDIVAQWRDEEVARRWWALFPKRRTKTQTPAEPRQSELDMLTDDQQLAGEAVQQAQHLAFANQQPVVPPHQPA
jgi:hypothetical protein